MATTPTGLFWDVTNPLKPTCRFDVNAILDIPYNWTDWLAEIGSSIQVVTMDPTLPMMVVQANVISAGQIVLARIKVDPLTYVDATHFNQTFGVRCHIKAVDGQEEDQTLWFKLVSK